VQPARTATNDWPEAARPVPAVAVSDTVRHKTFGTGRVLEVDGEGPRAIITVRFDTAGTKRLALGYAPLEVLSSPGRKRDRGTAGSTTEMH
jgi:hypothetical protein